MTEPTDDPFPRVWGSMESATRDYLTSTQTHPLHAVVLLYLAERCDSATTAQSAALARAYLAAVTVITAGASADDSADELLALLRAE